MEETHLPLRRHTTSEFAIHDGGRLAFGTTERIIQALGIRTGKQRLNTHIMSNMRHPHPLGLFCESCGCSFGP